MNFIAVLDIVPHLCPLTGEGNHLFKKSRPPKSEHLPMPMEHASSTGPPAVMEEGRRGGGGGGISS